MLGIHMEEGVESGLGVPSKKQPADPKVQPITSFFKSPTNSEAKKGNTEKKAQDLFGYFKSCDKTKKNKHEKDNEDHTEKQDNSVITKNDSRLGNIPCKSAKRKIDDLNSSLEDFETSPTINSTCSDPTERPPLKKKVTKVKNSKQKIEKTPLNNKSEKEDDVKKQEISYEDFLKEKIENSFESQANDICQDPERQELKKNPKHLNNCKLNGEIIPSEAAAPVKSTEPEEISYLDFLNQTGDGAIENKEFDGQKPEKYEDNVSVSKPSDREMMSSPTKNVKLRPPKKNETPTKLKPDEEEDEDAMSKPVPKCHSITSFFTKTTAKAANKALFKKQVDYSTLTIRAMVHPEPSPPRNAVNLSVSPAHSTGSSVEEVKSNVSVKEADMDMSITLLESTIIEIPDKKCKKDVRKRLVSSDEEDSCEGITSLTNDTSKSDDVICMEGIEKLPEESTETEKDIIPQVELVDENEQKCITSDKNAISQTSKMEEENDETLTSQKMEEIPDKLKEERKNITAVKMASLDSIQLDMKKKSTQATLSFGSGKMGVIKAQIPKPEISLVDEKINSENPDKTKDCKKTNKNKLQVKKTKKETCVNTASSDIKDSSLKPKPKMLKKKGSETKNNNNTVNTLDTSATDFDILSPVPNESKNTKKRVKRGNSAQNLLESPRRRALKNIYKTSVKKKTPLKIRFTKIKSLNDADDDLTPNSKKRVVRLSKAQELLMKAKIPATKNKRKLAVKKVAPSQFSQAKKAESLTPMRRSSRQSAMVATIAINECYEVDNWPRNKSSDKENLQEKPTKTITPSVQKTSLTPKKQKNNSLTPKKQKNKSPKKLVKKGGKFAPIFQSKKGTAASKQDDEDVQIIETDPEVLKVKRAFLMSGIPENLKKQTESIATNIDVVCSVFPKESHVQQIPTEISEKERLFWNLPSVALKLREWTDTIMGITQKFQCLGEITQSKDIVHKNAVDTEFTKHVEISDEIMKYLLAEVNLTNPAFPVKKMYKQLKRLKCKFSGTQNLDSQEATVNAGKGKPKTNKRKCPDEDSDTATKRRSKRRKESKKSENVILDDSPEKEVGKETSQPENEGKVEKDMLWTEKYQPQSSSELIGNQTAVKKMKSWLLEWKQKTDLENKKMKKQLMKAAKQSSDCKEEIRKKLGDDWLTDDESDFDLGSSDEDEECTDEFSLCNTMLVTGPHGIGKTSLVYALAEELGYKVFEVNASTRRNGKQILAQLQEATQSHQVSRKNLDSMFTSFSMIKEQSTPKKEGPKAEKKMATAFTNFFKKGAKTEKDTKEHEKKKGRKALDKGGDTKKGKTEDKQKTVAQELFGGDLANTKKGLNLSSLSLILFEEVDIVFEEDKGFWNAIQTFIGTTKRPILLTTNDPTFASKFDARMELNTLKIPSYMNTASYLQVVSLCENMRTDFQDLVSLVSYNKGDIRKSLLTLQYWAESGGGLVKYPKPIKYSKTFFTKRGVGIGGGDQITNSPMLELSCSQDSNTLSQSRYESADEFETPQKVKRGRNKRFRIEDDNSMESGSQSPVSKSSCGPMLTALAGEDSQAAQDVMLFRSQSSQGTSSSVISVEDIEIADVVGPSVHFGCLQSTNGMTAFLSTKSDDVLALLQTSKTTNISDLDSYCKVLGFNIVYNNLYQLLPLPKVVSPLPLSLGIRPPIQQHFDIFPLPPKPSRILNRSELFDSEGSDSESSNVQGEEEKEKQSIQNKDLEKQNSMKDKKKSEKKPGDDVLLSSIQAFSGFYDNLSYADSFLTADQIFKEGPCSSCNNEFYWSSAKMTPGQTDQKRNFDESNWWKHNYANDIGAYVETLSLRTLQRKCKDHLVSVKGIQSQDNSCLEQLQIPVENSQAGIRFNQERATQLSSGANYKKTAGSVAANLPIHVQGQKTAIAMDYLPMFRDVCKSEQIRQAAKTKRRFLHYFDQISMKGMKQSVLDTLCSSFS